MAHLDENGVLVACGPVYTKPKEAANQFRRILAMGPDARQKLRAAMAPDRYVLYETLASLTPWQLSRLEARYPRTLDLTLEIVQDFSKGS